MKLNVIYLCVKKHKITKLNYFCKTTKKDPVKYLGSGKYWRDHLKVHGKLVETSAKSTAKRKEWSSKKSQELLANGIHPFIGNNENRLKNGTHPLQVKVSCVCCKTTSSVGMFKRWHDGKCKLAGEKYA
jgi:hypothetical protein